MSAKLEVGSLTINKDSNSNAVLKTTNAGQNFFLLNNYVNDLPPTLFFTNKESEFADPNGIISAGSFYGDFNGNVTGNVTGNVIGNITGKLNTVTTGSNTFVMNSTDVTTFTWSSLGGLYTGSYIFSFTGYVTNGTGSANITNYFVQVYGGGVIKCGGIIQVGGNGALTNIRQSFSALCVFTGTITIDVFRKSGDNITNNFIYSDFSVVKIG